MTTEREIDFIRKAMLNALDPHLGEILTVENASNIIDETVARLVQLKLEFTQEEK